MSSPFMSSEFSSSLPNGTILGGTPGANVQHHSGPMDMDKSLSARTTAALAQTAAGSDNDHTASAPVADLMHDPVAAWNEHNEKILLGPYDYMLGHPGKDIRTQLIAAFNAWLQVPPESLQIITRVVGMLHTASLLVDDVEDSSHLRRGVPVAHAIFGVPQTINSANYVYFVALRELRALRKSTQAVDIYTEELLNLHRGQGMDLFWRDTLTCPREHEYLSMVANKTGGLFRLAVKLMQAESSAPRDCVPLCNTISLLFQILDDYSNLCSASYTLSKGLAEDLTEGKFSFPVLHAIRAAAPHDNRVLLSILRQRTTDDDVKRYAIAEMEAGGSFAYTRDVLARLNRRAVQLVDELDGGEGKGEGVRAILRRLEVRDVYDAGVHGAEPRPAAAAGATETQEQPGVAGNVQS